MSAVRLIGHHGQPAISWRDDWIGPAGDSSGFGWTAVLTAPVMLGTPPAAAVIEATECRRVLHILLPFPVVAMTAGHGMLDARVY